MPFPTSVDAIVDAPPITAATVIHASQVQGPQRITVGPVWFNVKSDQYGAVGDGVTNDAAAINSAITACNAAGGGVVYLPTTSGGTYLVGSSLVMASNVVLKGCGPG